MPLYLLKFPYRKILLPLAKKMKFIDPDILGYLATFIALLTMFCYLYAVKIPILLIVSIFLTFFRMTLNTIDGVIAIERGNLRLKGEIVNALPDRYSDIFILIGIGFSPLCSPLWGMIGMASMFLVSYTGMLGKAIGVEWQHHGPLGKVERLILIMIFSMLQYLNLTGKIGAIFSMTWFEVLMVLFLILGQITVYNRLVAQLRECHKSDWIKYRHANNLLCKKTLVLYESITGNTKKVAEAIADSLCADISEVAPCMDTSGYDFVVFASPNIRKEPGTKMKSFLDSSPKINAYSVVITAGMPIWRWFSSPACFKFFAQKLGKKPVSTLEIPGYHAKYKTYRNRPNDDDLLTAYLFAARSMERLSR